MWPPATTLQHGSLHGGKHNDLYVNLKLLVEYTYVIHSTLATGQGSAHNSPAFIQLSRTGWSNIGGHALSFFFTLLIINSHPDLRSTRTGMQAGKWVH